jgi:glycosyltransferase involved in cell wall biosynthesis
VQVTDILLISGGGSGAEDLARIAGDFTSSGCTVRIAVADAPGRAIPDDERAGLHAAEIRPLRMSLTGRRADGVAPRRWTAAWAQVVLRNTVVRTWVRIAGRSRRTWLMAKYDPWLRRAVRDADVILAADGGARRTVRHLHSRQPGKAGRVVMAVGDKEYVGLRHRALAVRPLLQILRKRSAGLPPEAVIAAWQKVAADPDDLFHHGVARRALEIVRALRRFEALDVVGQVGQSAMGLAIADLDKDRIRLELVMAQIAHGAPPDGLAEAVRAVARQADGLLREGDTRASAALAVEAADAMFSRELHADALSTPLVATPEEFLAPLRESLTFRALTAPSGAFVDGFERVRYVRDRPADALASSRHPAANPTPASGSDATTTPRSGTGRSTGPVRQGACAHRILVVPGDYPHFTQGIIDTLEAYDDVELRVMSLRDPGVNRRTKRLTMATDRLNDALGVPVPPLEAPDAELLAWPDTVFVDWCDNAAQWVALHAPAHVRLVIRLHSLEAISHQPHMIDWSRVSDLIFVAGHVRHLVERAVPRVAAAGRLHVVPNEMRLHRFGLPKRPGAERTVAMVGWAQRVKDPLWALEVVARLLDHDPAWRLLLVGHDFSDRQHLGALRYRNEFRARASDDDVRGALVRVPYTDDLPDALRDAGFILSASRREGFPVGTTEGAASGAVPVIRDWPMYASVGGARGIYPAEWVVETPDEAANRILAHADPEVRSKAGEVARAQVVERFDWTVVAPVFREILLGAVSRGPAGSSPS